LKPSLEGWKLGAVITLFQGGLSLETFLRGMETAPDGPHHPAPRALETFLRGMETRTSTLCWSAFLALKPSLEGWKLILDNNLTFLTALETFLRGMETGEACNLSGGGDGLETFLRGMETTETSPSPSP